MRKRHLSWMFSKASFYLQIFVLATLLRNSCESNENAGLDYVIDTSTLNETITILFSDTTTQRVDTVTPNIQDEDALTITTTASTVSMEHGGNSSSENENITQGTLSSTSMPNFTSNVTTPNNIFEVMTKETITLHSSWIQIYQPSLQDMEEMVQWQHVEDYLSKFENDIQREIITNQIKFCPYHSLCDFEPIAFPGSNSCCVPCDCNLDTCMENNTCCPSVLPESLYTLPSNKDPDVSNSRKNMKDTQESDSTCISKHLSHQTGKGFEAIARCPTGSNAYFSNLCTKVYTTKMVLSDIVPVSSRTTQQVFRNKYCALCNNVSNSDMDYFKALFSCQNHSAIDNIADVQDAISLAYSTDNCDITFLRNNSNILLRECKYVIDSCNVTGIWKTYDPAMEFACSLYSSITRDGDVSYRNAFCSLCNGNVPIVSCNTDHPAKSETFPFSGLLSLDSRQAIASRDPPSTKDTQSSCSSNQMFDFLFEKCRQLVCPKSTYYRSGSCNAVYSAVVSNIIYVVDMRLIPTTTLTVEEMLEIEGDVFGEIFDRINNIRDYFAVCHSQTALKTDMEYSLGESFSGRPGLSYIDIRYKMFLLQYAGFQSPLTIVDSILAMRHNVIQVNRSHGEPLEFRIVLTQFDNRKINLIETVNNNPEFRWLFLKNASERLEVLSQYAFSDVDGLTIIPNNPALFTPQCMVENEQIEVIKHSSCPRVSVSSNDIKWNNVVDGIVVDGLKIDRSTFYFIDNQHIMMCLEQYKALAQHLLPSRSLNTEIIVSVACTCLSIISLLVTIITFAIFPKLHKSLPGHNNISLSVSLLIAQIMLLIGSISPFDQYSTECKTVGLVIHFSWLCVVFWMNVCTYHVFRTLTRSELPKQTFEVKKCVLYHLYVLVSSMIFVGLNILISTLESDELGYGGKYCYITSQQRILITFVAPTILVVLIDLFMFLIVIRKVTKTSDVRKSVKHERNDLVIFAKLASLTGISWIFGFLYIWTNISALSYVFTVLNAGQGVFIMISFVLNHRVRSMFKDLFRKTEKADISGRKQTRVTSSEVL